MQEQTKRSSEKELKRENERKKERLRERRTCHREKETETLMSMRNREGGRIREETDTEAEGKIEI